MPTPSSPLIFKRKRKRKHPLIPSTPLPPCNVKKMKQSLLHLSPAPSPSPSPAPSLFLPPSSHSLKSPSSLRSPSPLPPNPSLPLKLPNCPSPSPSPKFADHILFLESLGLDPLPLISAHPLILSVPLSDLRSSVHLLLHLDLRRLSLLCPQALTTPSNSLASVAAFLLREAAVPDPRLPHAIHRRPSLLISDVTTQLRPTLYFLQMLGIPDVHRHTYLLSCSVEDKLIPRLDFLQSAGFSSHDAKSMLRRFPPLFCYGIESNLAVKLRFLVEEMEGREMSEVREFPDYFSYSLEKRIKKRHLVCEEKGVRFPLPAMLKPSDKEFEKRVEV